MGEVLPESGRIRVAGRIGKRSCKQERGRPWRKKMNVPIGDGGFGGGIRGNKGQG